MKPVRFIKPVLTAGYFEHDHVVKLFKAGDEHVVRNLWQEFYPGLVLFLMQTTNASPQESIGLPRIVTAGFKDFVEFMKMRSDECEDFIADLYRMVKAKAIELLYTENRREEIKSWQDKSVQAFIEAECFRSMRGKTKPGMPDKTGENSLHGNPGMILTIRP